MSRKVVTSAIRAWLAIVSWIAGLRSRGPQRLLRLRLAGELAEETAPPRFWSYLGPRGDDYLSVIGVLRWAREDPDLRGVLISIDRLGAGWARLQGLRRALVEIRAAGKTVWVHLTHAGVREYLVATGADRIVITPAGVLDVAGLSAEATFFLGALEKLGVRAELVQVGAYKAAAEPFTRRTMSPEHREMIEAMVDDLYNQLGEAVAESRGIAREEALALLGRGPFVAREAREARLVDDVAYLDEIEKQLSDLNEGAALVERKVYAAHRGREMRRRALRENRKAIALLHLSGPIKSGESTPAMPAGASGSDTLCRELDAIAKRDDIGAVVVRINSPGGSGLASDLIWRGVHRLREKKPVVVSMGDVAASGGYYVAAAAAPVFAEGGTLTGSIGVIAGKASLQGLYDQLGVNKEIVSRGEHAGIHSDYRPLGASERERLEAEARFFYDDFVQKVADGRGIPVDDVARVAQGRVWTGRQALAHKLVDRLGGLDDALAEAKSLAGIPRDTPVGLVRLPRQRRNWGLSLLQRLPFGERLESALSPWLGVTLHERIWAVLPYEIRFF